MQLSLLNVALQSVNFLVLAWLLQRFLFKPIRRVIDNRQKELAARVEQAEAKQKEAESVVDEYRHKMADIWVEAERELQRARRQGEEDARRMRTEAERKAREIGERARAEIRQEREHALRDLGTRALTLAQSIAEKLVRETAPDSDETFLSRAMLAVDGLGPPERRAMVDGLANGHVEVISARPLCAEARERFGSWLAAMAGGPLPVSFEVDATLLAGVRVRIAQSVWQFNWRSSLSKIRSELENHDAAA